MAQSDQSKAKLNSAKETVQARLPECYQWLLVPGRPRPVQGQKFPGIEWHELRLQGQEPLAVRVSRRLLKEELLLTSMAGTRLRLEIDQIPLWRNGHVGVKQLIEDFAKYLYLPRVKNAQVVLDAVQSGINLRTWSQESFAYADSYDAAAGRYRGLSNPPHTTSIVRHDSSSVIVKPDIAAAQIEKDLAAAKIQNSSTPMPVPAGGNANSPTSSSSAQPTVPQARPLRRFHGAVTVDATRLSRDVDTIASAVVQHLTSLLDANVSVTIEINADVPSGTPDNVVRTVTENCRTLKFQSAGFEES
jgi:hypothetical protein